MLILQPPNFNIVCGEFIVYEWTHDNSNEIVVTKLDDVSLYKIEIDCTNQICTPGDYNVKAIIQFEKYTGEDEAFFYSESINVKIKPKPPPTQDSFLTKEQLEKLDLKTLEPQFVVKPPLEEWLLLMGAFG